MSNVSCTFTDMESIIVHTKEQEQLFLRDLYEWLIEHGIEVTKEEGCHLINKRDGRLKYGLSEDDDYFAFIFQIKFQGEKKLLKACITDEQLLEPFAGKNYIWRFWNMDPYTRTFEEVLTKLSLIEHV